MIWVVFLLAFGLIEANQHNQSSHNDDVLVFSQVVSCDSIKNEVIFRKAIS